MRPSFLKRTSFAFAMVLLMTATPASAYLLTTSQISRQMVKKMGQSTTVTLTQRETFFPAPPSMEEPKVFEEMVTLQPPDRYHSLIDDGSKKVETFATSDLKFRVVGGERIDLEEGSESCYRHPLQLRKRALFETQLAHCGVDVSTTSLGRHNGRIAWVVGAKAGMVSSQLKPQFWVDKENFLPMRWIRSLPDGRVLEIWYHDWFTKGNASYPARIEFYRNGFLFREIQISNITKAKAISASRFDPTSYNEAKVMAPPAAANPPVLGEGERRMQELNDILTKDPLAF